MVVEAMPRPTRRAGLGTCAMKPSYGSRTTDSYISEFWLVPTALPQLRGSPESVDTLIGLILVGSRFLLAAMQTAVRRRCPGGAPAGPSGPRRYDLDAAEHWRILAGRRSRVMVRLPPPWLPASARRPPGASSGRPS